MHIPGIIIAGTNSGCGKTTVTAGILAALVKRGLKVQPFKAGPDFIDPMFHTFVTGNSSRNLDSWLMDEKTVRHLYARSASKADFTLIEGVMGYYDGFGGRSEAGSTAHIAKLTGLPVILVVNPDGMALSAAALIKGFMDFDGGENIKGIIFNNISSEGHFRLIKELVEENTDAFVLGYLKKSEEYGFESRHLGLITAEEIEGLEGKLEKLRGQVEETLNLNALIEIAAKAAPFFFDESLCVFDRPEPFKTDCISKVKIAVAWDKAFCFYYRDNLELLESMGAELVFFSPLYDNKLPDRIDGLYIGGGYPEVWAAELERNVSMRQDIKMKVTEGLPAYAECGGLMYMCRNVRDVNGSLFKMVGLIPGTSEMTQSLKRFGYVDINMIADNVHSLKGWKIRGHEFHFSEVKADQSIETSYRVMRKRADKVEDSWFCGYKVNNLLAGYAHLHFWSNPAFARQFVENCRRLKESG